MSQSPRIDMAPEEILPARYSARSECMQNVSTVFTYADDKGRGGAQIIDESMLPKSDHSISYFLGNFIVFSFRGLRIAKCSLLTQSPYKQFEQ